jgi:hypothetical protein
MLRKTCKGIGTDTSTTEYQYQNDLCSRCWQLRIWSLFISTCEEGNPELINLGYLVDILKGSHVVSAGLL